MHQRQHENIHTGCRETNEGAPQGAHCDAIHAVVLEGIAHYWPKEQPGKESVGKTVSTREQLNTWWLRVTCKS